MRKQDVNPYKLDTRTKDEFIKDMERGLTNEASAIRKLKEILDSCTCIESVNVVHTGSEEEGKVVMEGNDIANVDVFPDYLVRYKNNRLRIGYKLVEVKVCNPHSPYAYFKKRQLEQYAELESVLILFVMGMSKTDPRFILVKPEDILNLGIEAEMVYGKETFKVPVNTFYWERFQAHERNYNPLLKDYLRRD